MPGEPYTGLPLGKGFVQFRKQLSKVVFWWTCTCTTATDGTICGAHQPIMGENGSGSKGVVAQQTPMASILSVSWSHVCHVSEEAMQVTMCLPSPHHPVSSSNSPSSTISSPMIKDAHRKLYSTRCNPVASSDVVRPSNLIQQTPYLHHPSILYGNPLGITSSQLVNPVSVVPAVVAPPLQTQLHHGCVLLVSQIMPNGNTVNCQSNMDRKVGVTSGCVM